jgi:hypothetical protein
VPRGEQPDVIYIKYNQPKKQDGRRQSYGPNNNRPPQHQDPSQWRHHAITVEKKSIYLQCVNAVEEFKDEILFFGEISSDVNYWTAQLGVDGHSTRFKLDTGQLVTVPSNQTPWLKNRKLIGTQKILRGPGNTQFPVKGMLSHFKISSKKNSGTSVCFV